MLIELMIRHRHAESMIGRNEFDGSACSRTHRLSCFVFFHVVIAFFVY
jgi:hypothetical protein